MKDGDVGTMETTQPAPLKVETPIQVLLFASLKDAAGADHVEVRLPTAAVPVAEFLTCCGQQHPALMPWLPHVKVAINCSYANPDDMVRAGDEIALLPPVAGG